MGDSRLRHCRTRPSRWGRAPCAIAGLVLASAVALAQQRGEIRLEVRDSKGGALQALVELVSEANQVNRSFSTGADGSYVVRELSFGRYRLRVSRAGFLTGEQLVVVRSEVPVALSVTLGLAPVENRVDVTDRCTAQRGGSAQRRVLAEA